MDKHVFVNKDDSYVHSRKYLGAVLEINDYKYYIPLPSPKDSDYTEDSKGNKIVRKSIIPIIRMKRDYTFANIKTEQYDSCFHRTFNII